jgi:ABC-2 type transport system ATP-binding protein
VQMICKRVAIIKEGKIIQLEDIDNLRKKQLKKVTVEFNAQVNQETLRIPGIESKILALNNILSFMYSGNINDLVSYLSGKKILNLIIEEPSLDEIFLHYYKN